MKSRKSKYDIAMKSFMLSQDSELRTMLRLPPGDAYAAELPGYDGRATDTIVVGDKVHHVEFQTKDVDEMPWRMLEYYWILYRQYSYDFEKEREIDQTLVYIGSDQEPYRMKPPLKKENLTFSYRYEDLRDIGARSTVDLLGSIRPFDWILGVLCYWKVDRRTWERVATKVNDHCRLKPHASQNLKVHLLVAMALRNLDYHLARKLCDMLEVQMEKVPAFKEKIDDAEHIGIVTGVAESIQQFVMAQLDLEDDGALDELFNFPLDHLQELRGRCYRATSPKELRAVISAKFRELGAQYGG
ncbi:hypothetical protein GOD83_24630 [Sinorhizobium medicae]|nr:hypothetical protein [Sinorhizobium medicae]MDX0579831.1 hypothetical protein [Sinorhizobium medicae]MDX0783465.1 hypothetical protein [Sinorhizobium medicae]